MEKPECKNCREEVLIAADDGYCLECHAAFKAGVSKAIEVLKGLIK